MRKLVLYTLMSLDGAVDQPADYFAPRAGSGGPPEFDAVMEDNENEVIARQDAVLLGRGMYDEWSRFWPTVQDQPFADFINTVSKHVVTSTPLESDWSGAEAVQGPVEDVVHELKDRDGGDLGVHGSITLAQSLLAVGLVDELRLVVGPAWGFPGRRLFPDGEAPRRLELLSSRSTPTGSLLLHYRLG